MNHRLLIVNADDYGLTEMVSRGILRAFRSGIVTSLSVLPVGPAFDRTVPWLLEEPGLGVGIHLAAVGEDPPVLSATEIPTLVDRRGNFPLSWRAFLRRAITGRVDFEDLVREFTAQAQRVLSLGIHPTHLDAHQHLHLWPPVGRVVIDLAKSLKIPAIRIPRSASRSLKGIGVNRLARALTARASTAGLLWPQDAAGLDEAGRMDLVAVETALERFVSRGTSTAELFVHPGEDPDGDRDRYRWGYRWADELECLTGPEVREAIASRGFELVSYAALTKAGSQ